MTDQTLSGYRIIIVEDDYYQAQDCKQTLEQAGAQVITASATVPNLVGLLAQGRIDAALIDINLGNCSSLDFARDLCAREIPFAFLTGYDAAVLPADLANSPYLSKPANSAKVLATVVSLVKDKGSS